MKANWQPVSTAPKDGREIMFCRKPPFASSGNITIGFWHDGQNIPGWMCTREYGVIVESVWTHWAPLPDLPADQ